MNGAGQMNDICRKYMIEEFDDEGKLKNVWFEVPEDFNFAYDIVDVIAENDPSKRAIVFKSLEGKVTTYTFGDLSERSSRIAALLCGKGIKKGDRVMLIMKRRVEYWFVMTALHKLGAVAIPTSDMVSDEDITYRIKDADVKCVICADDEKILSNVDRASEIISEKYGINILKFVTLGNREGYYDLGKETECAPAAFERIKTNVNDTMMLYFTSGTTGEPKAVMHNYSYPLSHIITARDWHGVVDGGLHFAVADSGWAKSAWGKMYGQWICGSAVMVYDYEQFYANEILQILQDCRVDTFCAPPTIYKYLLRENLEDYNLSNLKQVVTAGEPMPVEVMEKFRQRTGLSIRIGFGQTETALITGVLCGEEQRLDCIGKPSPMYDVKIVDDDGNETKPLETGELVIVRSGGKGYPVGIFSGYNNDSEMYDEVCEGGVYHTKDKVYRDEDGNIYFVSRTDDVIKSSGYRIGPVEVENVLMKHPAVFECAVTGYPSETRGSIVKASIVLHKGYEPSPRLKVEIKDFVKSRTAMYKCPRMIEFYDSLPKTVSGKISREKIRRKDMESM